MSILRDVGESIKELLRNNIAGLQPDSIVFDSPAVIDTAGLTSPKISVFLYQAVTSTYLRNMEAAPVGTDKLRYPPLTVDLHYLFTPYATDRETELILLEQVMQVLFDAAVLKGTALKGNLAAGGNEEIRILSDSLTLEELNKLWGMFSNKPFKLSAIYIATSVRIPSGKPDMAISRVLQKNITMGQK